MLSEEENARLTQVSAGTPAGDMLRRYWFPVTTEERLAREPVQRVRLLGEDLVVFRDGAGKLGLVAERCPHRGASLGYGFPEAEGLRCPYHGWMFDTSGECLDTPNTAPDSPRFRADCSIPAFSVRAMSGLVFGYLGPHPAPALPRYDLFAIEEEGLTFRDVGFAVIPCNWLQIVENSLDPLHVEWLHGQLFNYYLELAGEERTALGGRHVKIAFDEFEHGIVKRRLREGQSELEDDWTVGHPLVFPGMLKVGGKGMAQFQIRVPMDDHNTLHFWYTVFELPEHQADIAEMARQLPSSYEVKLRYPDGRFRLDTIDAQDAMAWVTQGPIADRSIEHLCASDRGILLYRKQLLEQIDAVDSGRVPINVFVDDGTPQPVLALPMEQKELGMGGGSDNHLATYLRTQLRYSNRLPVAVRAIDEALGLGPRQLLEQLG